MQSAKMYFSFKMYRIELIIKEEKIYPVIISTISYDKQKATIFQKRPFKKGYEK